MSKKKHHTIEQPSNSCDDDIEFCETIIMARRPIVTKNQFEKLVALETELFGDEQDPSTDEGDDVG